MEEQNKGQIKDKSSISLGGNIQLNGFQNLQGAKMIVLRKIAGNYTKQIQEKRKDYERLTLTLEGDESNATIKAELKAGGSQITAEDTQNNMFVALDNTFKKILGQI